MTDKPLLENEGPVWIFATGLVPGLTVALMQFLLSWAEFAQISKLRAMNIKGVLSSRDEADFYGELISKASETIDVEGVTASRLVQDFADENSHRDEKKVLIAALARGVKVRILVAESAHLAVDQKEKFSIAARLFSSLAQRYENFEIKYFNHQPTTSIVRVDDDILVGPVFSNIESRHTPTIHTSVNSNLGSSYLKHFDTEWSSARSLTAPNG